MKASFLPKPFFETGNASLYHADSFVVMDALLRTNKRFECIVVDPPYFLSNDGFSVHAGKRVSVNKGTWDKSNGFEKDGLFVRSWLERCRQLLTENGTIWVSGTLHNIFVVGSAMRLLGFKLLNDIAWFKPNAPPHLACRYFAHAHETLLWAAKDSRSKHTFNYEVMKHWDDPKDFVKNEGKQMRTVWSIGVAPQGEKLHGKHPTQKPIELLRRMILSSTNVGDFVLDPFCGSGTSGVVASKNGRRYIGIDDDKTFLAMARRRIEGSLLPAKASRSKRLA